MKSAIKLERAWATSGNLLLSALSTILLPPDDREERALITLHLPNNGFCFGHMWPRAPHLDPWAQVPYLQMFNVILYVHVCYWNRLGLAVLLSPQPHSPSSLPFPHATLHPPLSTLHSPLS